MFTNFKYLIVVEDLLNVMMMVMMLFVVDVDFGNDVDAVHYEQFYNDKCNYNCVRRDDNAIQRQIGRLIQFGTLFLNAF